MGATDLIKEKEFFAHQVLELPYELHLASDREIIEEMEEEGITLSYPNYINALKSKTGAARAEKRGKIALFWGARILIGFFAIIIFLDYSFPIIADLIAAIQATNRVEKLLMVKGWRAIPDEFRFGFWFLYLIFNLLFPIAFFSFFDYWIKRAFWWEKQKPNKNLLNLARILGYLENEQAKINAMADLNDLKYESTVYSDLYVPYEDNKFILRRVDPDWELESIMFGFLSEWNLRSILGFFITLVGLLIMFSFFAFAFTFMYLTSEAPLTLGAIANICLIALTWSPNWSIAIILSASFVHYCNCQIHDTICYIQIRNQLISSLTEQILDLSSEETLYFSRRDETEREIDRKLDLLSARMSLNHLQELPYFPLWNRFSFIIKSLGVLSIISLLYSFLVL
ncbi:MAG: hypothetical protein ACE5OZ_15270 [Candidatus Heimdallarchaeota archaeon]